MSKPMQLRFVCSVMSVRDLPSSPVEIAVVGRSNVGKSSLLNALANHRQLAKVSNTPGRTQSINLFARPDGSTLVDLPGYGYAKVPGALRSGWQEMIEGYLLQREPLVLTLVLVDGEIGPTKLDVQMLEWLRHERVSHGIVATKLDKIKPSKMAPRQAELAEKCFAEIDDIAWVSAPKGTGIGSLRSRIEDLLSA